MPFRRMQELQSQDFTSNCLLYVCGREFCAAGLSIHRTRETRHRRPWPAERALARTSSRFTYGSTWYVSSFNMTRILPPYFWIFWSSASSVSSPNQSLNSDHSMPNWIMPKHPSSGIQVESSCFWCIWFRCQSCLPNWKLQTNSDRVVVLSFGNPWGAPSTQPTSNLGFRYRTFLFLWWLGLRTGLTQVTLW